jgi:hypothetical protein
MTDPLVDRLTATHLLGQSAPTMDEMKRNVEASLEPAPSADDAKKLRMQERRYTFQFKFETKTKETFSGIFTSTIPDVKTRGLIGVLRAQLAGGMSYGSLDPFTNELNLMIATLTFVLSETKDMPSWAKDLRTIVDADVVYALFEEVSAHETTFLGR